MFIANWKRQLKSNTSWLKALSITALSALSLTGCYVEVSTQYSDSFSTSSSYTADVTEFNTQVILDATLIPFALAAESPYMVLNPDTYTTPRSRDIARSFVVETTYAYLFDNWLCAFGGETQAVAEADTTTYSDGFTFVDFFMNAQANQCQVEKNGDLHLVNSNLTYDLNGWVDDWSNKINSIDGSLTGQVQVEYRGHIIKHSSLNLSIDNVSATDFLVHGNGRTLIDDGYKYGTADLKTLQTVHWYLNANHPHLGKVRLQQGYHWVDLTFDSLGFWYENSRYQSSYWFWSNVLR